MYRIWMDVTSQARVQLNKSVLMEYAYVVMICAWQMLCVYVWLFRLLWASCLCSSMAFLPCMFVLVLLRGAVMIRLAALCSYDPFSIAVVFAAAAFAVAVSACLLRFRLLFLIILLFLILLSAHDNLMNASLFTIISRVHCRISLLFRCLFFCFVTTSCMLSYLQM